jgi:carboxyl-terminal processing protease
MEVMRERLGRLARTALLVSVSFAGGAIFSGGALAVLSEGDSAYRTLAVFARALHYIQTSWVGDIDDDKLVRGAIRGMVNDLDPHSRYLDPNEYEALRRDSADSFGGVGVRVARRGPDLVIAEASSDAPAARAGLKAGDAIVEVEGVPTRELAPEDVEKRLRGKPGTQVALLVHREARQGPEPLVLLREHLRDPSVRSTLLSPGVGYLRIRAFTDMTDREVGEALMELKKPGPIRALVLDLRDNSGGLLEQAVRVADRWIEDGVIVTTRAKGREPEVQKAHPKGTEPRYPMAALINGRSASSAEVLAAALGDHERAVLVGERSYGKASVQTVLELEDRSALKLTIARYYTPSGRLLEGTGITPDVVVPGVAGAIVGDTVDPSTDPQLARALESFAERGRDGSFTVPRPRAISKP